MRLTKLKLHNVACFSDLETELSAVVLINGKNGAGKTSLVKCIQYALGRGHDPDIWAEPDGQILLTWDDGTILRCCATSAGKGTDRGYKPADGRRWIPARDFLREVTDAIAYDPLRFIGMEDAEQVEELLRIIPLPPDVEALAAAVGDAGDEAEAALATLGANTNGLEAINAVVKVLYDRRREYNTAATSLEKHAEQLAAAPMVEDEKDWAGEFAMARQLLNNLNASLGTEEKDAAVKFERGKRHLENKRTESISEIDQSVNARIAAIQKEREESVAKINADHNAAVDHFATSHAQAAEEIRAKYEPQLREVTERITVAEERNKLSQQAAGTRDALTKARQQAEIKRAKWKSLDAALKRLDELKELTAAKLKIKNTIIEDGRICRHEGGRLVPFKNWNTASQYRFVLKVAIMAHSKAGIICLDGFHALDPDSQRIVCDGAKQFAEQENFQFIFIDVGPGPATLVDYINGDVLAELPEVRV